MELSDTRSSNAEVGPDTKAEEDGPEPGAEWRKSAGRSQTLHWTGNSVALTDHKWTPTKRCHLQSKNRSGGETSSPPDFQDWQVVKLKVGGPWSRATTPGGVPQSSKKLGVQGAKIDPTNLCLGSCGHRSPNVCLQHGGSRKARTITW